MTHSTAAVEGGWSARCPWKRGPVPVLPFSKEAVTPRRLRKTLAAYRLAFAHRAKMSSSSFLGTDRSDAELLLLASRLRIDLSPSELGR